MLSGDYDPGGVYPTFDIFMQMLPQNEVNYMVRLTSLYLSSKTGNKNDPTNSGELLKWIGVLILETRVEFGTCTSLRNKNIRGKYLKEPCFCHTGMVRYRVDLLWRRVRFSDQNKECPPEMTHEAWWWTL